VSEVIGSGGLIVPGDHVDVIGIFEMKFPADKNSAKASPASVSPITEEGQRAMLTSGATADELQTTFVATNVLENVTVLAVAQQLEGQDTRDNTQRVAQSAGVGGNNPTQQQLRSDPQALPAAKTATRGER
jgi:Flp pilus assembly protein CpaB